MNAQTAAREKVAEGQYERMRDNQAIPGSTQSWVLWRVPEGYQLEDHFESSGSPTASTGNAFADLELSAQAREKLKNQANANELQMTLNHDYTIESFVLRGKKILDEKQVDILSCDHDGNKIRCKGLQNDSKLSSHEQRGLFYAFPFPMIFSAFARAGEPLEPGKSASLPLALIDWLGQQRLDEVQGQVTHAGIETIRIGDKNLKLHRYDVKVSTRKGPIQSKLWASPGGLVVAMETTDVAGERMTLVQFKKYLDF